MKSYPSLVNFLDFVLKIYIFRFFKMKHLATKINITLQMTSYIWLVEQFRFARRTKAASSGQLFKNTLETLAFLSPRVVLVFKCRLNEDLAQWGNFFTSPEDTSLPIGIYQCALWACSHCCHLCIPESLESSWGWASLQSRGACCEQSAGWMDGKIHLNGRVN